MEFRIYLPPNIATSGPRDAIVVKVVLYIKGEGERNLQGVEGEVDVRELDEANLKVYWLLSQWSRGKVKGLYQLTRKQLRSLIEILVGRGVFFRVDHSTEALMWDGERLIGASDYLKEEVVEEVKKGGWLVGEKEVGKRLSVVKDKREEMTKVAGMKVDGNLKYLSIELPSREHRLYGEGLDLVKYNQFQLEPLNRKWWLRDKHRILNFLAANLEDLREKYQAEFGEVFRRFLEGVEFVEFKGKVDKEEGDGVGIEVHLRLEASGVESTDIQRGVMRGAYYIERNGGGVVLVDPKVLKKAEEVQRALSGRHNQELMPVYKKRLGQAREAEVMDLLDEVEMDVESKVWAERSRMMGDVSRMEMPAIEENLKRQLRGYQKIGVAWLWHLYKSGLGGILADEMGLGKTVQALGFLGVVSTVGSNDGECSLVVCPAGLVENWRREAMKFAPQLRVFCHSGDKRLKERDAFRHYDVVVMSYGVLIRDIDLLKEVRFRAVIVDEGQHIKNKRTQSSRGLRGLKAWGRFLLTGTPIENSFDDLRSLFAFLMPGFLASVPEGTKREEKDWYDKRLASQVAPYILRRSKKAVAPELPEKIEQVIYCEMEGKQEAFYKEYVERTQRAIFELEMGNASDGKVRMAVFSQILRLRQICADPRLLDEEMGVEDSAKLRVFKELIEEAVDGEHKVLVFSQFVTMLQLLRKELEEMGVAYCYLDGQTENRLEVCDRFNGDPKITVFLISLKAGGVGLNLASADNVILYDPWWNPATEAQAIDRAHRIGQKKVVTVIKLIMGGSIEERVMELQQTKAHMLKDLLEESDMVSASKLDVKVLKELLK